jgi:hypothetical protein
MTITGDDGMMPIHPALAFVMMISFLSLFLILVGEQDTFLSTLSSSHFFLTLSIIDGISLIRQSCFQQSVCFSSGQ